MPKPKKRVKKGRTIKAWALFYKGELDVDFIDRFTIYSKRSTALKTRDVQLLVKSSLFSKEIKVKPVLIKIEE